MHSPGRSTRSASARVTSYTELQSCEPRPDRPDQLGLDRLREVPSHVRLVRRIEHEIHILEAALNVEAAYRKKLKGGCGRCAEMSWRDDEARSYSAAGLLRAGKAAALVAACLSALHVTRMKASRRSRLGPLA